MPHGHFTTQDVAALFPGSENRRYALVKRAIAAGEIIHIRRGLYCLAPKYLKTPLNLHALAQRICGPSYITVESALAWHGWIPEAVRTITSASFKKSKQFDTPIGLFTYERVPQRVFYTDVERHTDQSGQPSLIATPAKALADYVYLRHKKWTNIDPLIADLRIDPEQLQQLTPSAIENLLENYTDTRVRNFLRALRKELSK
jgi:predicted transcriptional regulator of viral defense system